MRNRIIASITYLKQMKNKGKKTMILGCTTHNIFQCHHLGQAWRLEDQRNSPHKS